MTDLVVPLQAARDRASAGGKAFRLGALIRAGFDVPPGFVLTCDAYRRHLAAAGPELPLAGAAVDATQMRRLILDATVPGDIARSLEAALATLGSGAAVAVRSSAVAEDQGDASFAGQHDTFLDVQGVPAVLDAVRRCWASLWADRVVQYRAHRAAAADGVAIAVVVQQMAPAEHAGVAFTADPVTGERDRFIVNAVAGLGESLVSGRACADLYVLRRPDGAVIEEHVSGSHGAPLERQLLADLMAAGIRAEALFGAPQDLEWAAAGGRARLLQSRPITHLPPEPVTLADAEHPLLGYLDRWREMVPSPLTPLLGDLALEVVLPILQEAVTHHGWMPRATVARMGGAGRLVRGRLYMDLDLFATWLLPGLDPIRLADLAESGRRPPLRAVRVSALLPLLVRVPLLALRLLPQLGQLEAMARAASRVMDELLAPLEAADFETWDRRHLVAIFHLEPAAEFRDRLVAAPPANALARACAPIAYTAVGWMAARWAGEPAEAAAAALVAGLPGLVEVECAASLWELAEQARRVPEVARALEQDPETALDRLQGEPAAEDWRRSFAVFLARFGHRAIEEVELARPRWREKPAYPLSVIAGYLGCGPEASPRVAEARRRAEREAVETRVLRRFRHRPLRRYFFRRVLDAARQASLAGENTKSDIMRLFWVWRTAALELGRRLAEAGRLEAAQDVFFLRLAELKGAERDFRAEVSVRCAEHALWRAEDAPRIIDARGRPVREGLRRPAEISDGVLAGVGTSPGVARGPARIVLDPTDGVRLRRGDVLVAPFTDPAWTPLFFSAAAVVVEVGSLLSHASIVAREVGIPSVVGLAGATRSLREGEWVEVDGTRGTVRLLARG